MARHAASSHPRTALLRAGLTLGAAGALLGAGAAAAQAAPVEPLSVLGPDSPLGELPTTPGGPLTGAVGHSTAAGLAPAKRLRLDPLAGTGVDPLDNAVGTQVADFKPVSTAAVTGPVARGGALADLPLAGKATGLLPG
ncbi:hypothetical protein ABT160_24140 [Streptomyces sp. NPDC001941]|uniref:hypothetical protein n=1 Tax=Streptomyces sp. NPDC001941 TaxID=3154659 RepID=UPI0033241727